MKKSTILLFAFALTASVHAQSLVSAQYAVGFGTGDLKEHASKPSFLGFAIDYRMMTNPNLGVGLEIAWNRFRGSQPEGPYAFDGGVYTGKPYHKTTLFPVLLAVDYYFNPDGDGIKPFIGLGAGTIFSSRHTDFGGIEFDDKDRHFALRPEAGVLFNTSEHVKFSVTCKYYHGFEASELEAQTYFALSLGVVFLN